MFLLETSCPTCAIGTVALCRCVDGVQLAALCVRCDTLYPNPKTLSARSGVYPPHAGMPCDGPPTWATQNEIDIKGWSDLIVGEWVPARGVEMVEPAGW
jgi:hypothetical protein